MRVPTTHLIFFPQEPLISAVHLEYLLSPRPNIKQDYCTRNAPGLTGWEQFPTTFLKEAYINARGKKSPVSFKNA